MDGGSRDRTQEVFRENFPDERGRSFRNEVNCGKGTYIRSLARDLGPALGTVAHLGALRRLATSGFTVDDAISLGELEREGGEAALRDRLVPLAEALPDVPAIRIEPTEAERVANGQAIPRKSELDAEMFRLVGDLGELRALARADGDRLQPFRVFKQSQSR